MTQKIFFTLFFMSCFYCVSMAYLQDYFCEIPVVQLENKSILKNISLQWHGSEHQNLHVTFNTNNILGGNEQGLLYITLQFNGNGRFDTNILFYERNHLKSVVRRVELNTHMVELHEELFLDSKYGV